MTPSDLIDYIHARCVEDGGCWIWQGCMQSCGATPTFRLPGTRKTTSVRRALLQARGVPLTGKFATYTCESPRCVAPEHTAAVTRAQLQEMHGGHLAPDVKLRRDAKVAAQVRQRAKLTPDDVREIRSSDLSDAQLARQLGVTKYAVWAARTRRTWRFVEMAASPWAALMGGV